MKENLHDIDNIFKDAIGEHTDAPSEDVWKSIEQKLDKNNVVSIYKKYQRLKWIAAVLLLLLGAAAVYEITHYRNDKNKNEVAGDDKKINPAPETPVVKINPPRINSDNKNPLAPNTDSSSLIKNKNDNTALGTDTTSHINKIFTLKSRRSKTMGLAGDSLNQKNDADVTVKQHLQNNKNSKYKRSNLSASINKADAGILEELTILRDDDEQPLKKYYDLINSPFYQNKFDKFLSKLLPILKINLLPAAKAPANNIIKSSSVKNKKTGKASGFSITPFYSPDIAFNTLRDDHPHQGPGGGRDNKHDIKNDEKHGYDYSWGLFIDYALNKKISLQSGIGISKSSTNTKTKNIYAEKDNAGNTRYRVNASCGYGYIMPPPNTNPAVGDSIKALDAKNTVQYLQVPLVVKYNIVRGKFSFVPAAGLQVNLLTKGQIKTTTDNGSIKQTQSVNTVEGLKKSYLSGIISAGIQYSIGKKIDLQFVPTGRIGLNSINNGATVKTFSNSIGLSTGIKIKL